MKSTKVQTLGAGHAIVYTEVETLDREELNCHLQYVCTASLIDQAMSMEPPTAGMIRIILQGNLCR